MPSINMFGGGNALRQLNGMIESGRLDLEVDPDTGAFSGSIVAPGNSGGNGAVSFEADVAGVGTVDADGNLVYEGSGTASIELDTPGAQFSVVAEYDFTGGDTLTVEGTYEAEGSTPGTTYESAGELDFSIPGIDLELV